MVIFHSHGTFPQTENFSKKYLFDQGNFPQTENFSTFKNFMLIKEDFYE